MKRFACITLLICLAFAGCAGGKSMTLEQEVAVAKITDGHTLAGTLKFSGNSDAITVNAGDMKIRLGQPIMVVPRITLKGLEVDVYVIGPERGGIEAENF